jgi:transcriptional regulator with XRE-family HTH domain
MDSEKRSINSMELRKRAGLSRMQVAFALGVSEGTVAKWEQGKMEPHLPFWKVQILLELYNCTIQDLVLAFPSSNTGKEKSVTEIQVNKDFAMAS